MDLSYGTYPILNFFLFTFLLTLFFISLLYIPRILYLSLLSLIRSLHRKTRRKTTHLEARQWVRESGMDFEALQHASQYKVAANMKVRTKREVGMKKNRRVSRWLRDFEGEGEDEENNPWVWSGRGRDEEMMMDVETGMGMVRYRGDGDEKLGFSKLAEGTRWLHVAGKDGEGANRNENGKDMGGGWGNIPIR